MSLLKILQDYKEDLISALEWADEKFVNMLVKHQILSDSEYQDFCTLDHDRLNSRLQARYLLRLVCWHIQCDQHQEERKNDIFVTFTSVLARFDFSLNLSLILQNELAKCGVSLVGHQAVCDIGITLQDSHIPVLTEVLGDCKHKWKAIGIALCLHTSIIEECGLDTSNSNRLYNILMNWHQNAKHAHLKIIKKALQSDLVGMNALANKLNEKFREKISAITSIDGVSVTKIEYQSSEIEVTDGKSTLLGVQIPQSETATYQWMKEGQHLSNDLIYSGVCTDILFIRKACQGIDGNYTCEIRRDDKEQIKEVRVSLIYCPEKKCLLDRYSLLNDIPRDSWPPVGTSTYIELALIHEKRNIQKKYDYSIRGDIDDILKEKDKMEYKRLFGNHEHKALVLLEGRPGSGKTTLTHKLTRDWATKPDILRGAKLVFLVSLRMLGSSENYKSLSNILELFYNEEHVKVVTEMLESSYGEGACFILDGLDEYRNPARVITKLLNKQYLPNAMIIVASRPVGTAELRHTKLVTTRIEVLGFSKDQIFNYIHKYDFDIGNEASELEAYLNSHINVLHMCYLPVHSAMICYIYDQCERIPNTESKIYELFTLLTITRKPERDGSRHLLQSLQDLDGNKKEHFASICKLACDMTINSKQTLLQSETSISLSDGSGCDIYSLGLVTVDSTAKLFGFENVYAFLHLTFQEFLAAFHIASQDEDEELRIICDYVDRKEMLVVWKFYCGIIKLKDRQLQAILSGTQMNHMQKIQCAFEYQQKNACDYIIDKKSGVLSFENHVFSPTDFNAIHFVLSRTSSDIDLVLNNCVLDQTGITNTYQINQIKSLSFSTTYGIKQFEVLNLFLMTNIPSLETLDLISQKLGEEEILALTNNVTLSNLKILKIKMPLKASTPTYNPIQMLRRMSFNSKNLAKVQYKYYRNKSESHKQCLSYLLDAFECKIVPLCKFPENIFCNLNVDLSKVTSFLCLSSVILIDCKIDDHGVQVLTNTQFSTMFDTLRLDVNRITDTGAGFLSKLLSNCSILKHLSLSYNHVGSEGAMAFAGALVANHSLIELDLQGNAIGVEGAVAIAEAIKDFPSEFQLLLWNINITSEGRSKVLEYRRTAKIEERMTEHVWKEVSVDNVDNAEFVVHILRSFYQQKNLDFDAKSFKLFKSKELTDSLKDLKQFERLGLFLMNYIPSLENLDLTCRQLSKEEILALTTKVTLSNIRILKISMPLRVSRQNFDTAEVLKRLSFNSINLQQVYYKYCKNVYVSHTHCLSHLLESFECEIIPLCKFPQNILSNVYVNLSRVTSFLCLSSLILINCNIDDHGVQVLTKTKLTMYKEIRLDINRITDTGAEILSNLVSECTELQHLSLSYNHIDDQGAMALAGALVANLSLIELDLQCNAIGDEGAVAIAKAIKDFPKDFQLLLWSINITSEGQAKVLEYRKTAQIQEDMTKHTWREVKDSPHNIVHTLKFIYQHSNIAFNGKTFDLTAMNASVNRLQKDEDLKQCELLNKFLATNVSTLESVDLTTLNLGKQEILALTTDVTLSDLKVLKIKMPLKTSYPTFDSIEFIRLLSFNSKKLQQVHFHYCEDTFESQKQSLSCLLESFKCEIIQHCKFPSNILSNLYVNLSRVTSFFIVSSLILINCNIDDNGVQVLTKKKSGTNLEVLRLDVNRITDTGAEILSNLVSESTELQHLSLSCNHIGNKGAMALAGALVANHSLIELDLQCNAIGDEGAVAIAKAIKDFPNEFQLLLWNINITPEGQAKVLEYRKTAQIQEEMTKHTWREVKDGPHDIVHILKFIYQHSNIHFNGKTFDLSATNASVNRLQKDEDLKQCELLNKYLVTNVSALESVDLTTLNLGKQEILALTTDVTLSDLKVLKIKMPLKSSYLTFSSIELLRLLSFNSKKLQQVHFHYCEDTFESQKQSLSCLLESFKCEIIPHCKFPSNILSNLYVNLSRVTSFFIVSSLILINCNIDDNGVQVLTKKKSGRNLEILRLDVNRITDTGAEILSNLVSECTELQHLSLSCNHIGNKGAMALAGALVANHSLIELDLQCNAIGDEGAVAIAKAIKDFPNEFQLLLWNINITPEGQAKVLEYRKTAQIQEEMTKHTWREVKDGPHNIVHILKFIYQHSNIHFNGKTFDLSATNASVNRLQKDEDLKECELLNKYLVTNVSALESVDLTTLNLGKQEILALTTDVTLSDLKVLKIKMPLKPFYWTFSSIELLRLLSFNSKKLQQVYFHCEDTFESQKQSLSCLLDSFKCEIIPLCKFPSNILCNLKDVNLSRVTSFFTLSSLILINCNIDDNGVQVLTKTKSGTNFEILRLDVNRITDTGAEILSNLVSESTELQHLSLSYNSIGNKGAMALAGALVANHSLIELDLQCNAIGDEGALAIAEAVKDFPNEFQLLLWNINITPEGQAKVLEYKQTAKIHKEKTEHTWRIVDMYRTVDISKYLRMKNYAVLQK